MSQFRLTQISDTHLARRLTKLTANFERVSEYIDTTRPDLVVNTGDIAFDGPANPSDLEFARNLHDVLPVACRYLPGNHDIGDNPTQIGPMPPQPVYRNWPARLCLGFRRRSLAVRSRRLVLYRAQFAGDELRSHQRGRAV